MVSCIMTEGRYLPTRSDDSRKEEIREILREVINFVLHTKRIGSDPSRDFSHLIALTILKTLSILF